LQKISSYITLEICRILASGMMMEEVSVKMDASVEDLTKLLNN